MKSFAAALTATLTTTLFLSSGWTLAADSDSDSDPIFDARTAAAIEGVYSGTYDDRTLVVTVVQTGRSAHDVGVTVVFPAPYVSYGMAHTTYLPDEDRYEVHRYAQGAAPDTDYYASFTVDRHTGLLTGELVTDFQYIPLSAARIETLASYWTGASIADAPATPYGSYQGMLPNERTVRVDVLRTSRGPRALVTFNVGRTDTTGIQLDVVHYNSANGALYMTTSSPTDAGAIIQLRAQLIGDQLSGEYIVGGRAKLLKIQATRRR